MQAVQCQQKVKLSPESLAQKRSSQPWFGRSAVWIHPVEFGAGNDAQGLEAKRLLPGPEDQSRQAPQDPWMMRQFL